ncbi:MAG TPA: DsbA family protein [Caulobacteraceae bacterium]|jgi:protein-disulfide isomerase|nr:DsbA family protein [Caulobacteraceae bacterium]
MRLIPAFGLIAALVLATAACGQTGPAKSAQAVGGDQIRAYILEHPEIIEEAMGKLQAKRQADADAQLRVALAQNRSKIDRDPRDFVAGNPDGKITVVEFFDYRCPYCKAALPEIQKLVATNKDVRFVLKEFPILSQESESAARAAIAAKAQGKYWPVHQALLAEKNLDDAAIERILKANGVDMAKAKADAVLKSTTAQIEETHALAKASGVTGTPAFVIGDKMISGWVPAEVQAGIAAARKAG